MRSLDDIPNRLRGIATEVAQSARTDPSTNNIGWGQFVDALAHSHQIGAYGTCAAILTIMEGDPGHPIDQRIAAQIEEFWRGTSKGAIKLRSQNIRLAFLVLCLAKTTDARLAQVRDEAINELRGRQFKNGAWGDWEHPTEATQARSETTAWVSLGLSRASQGDAHAVRGAEYLLTEITGTASSKRLSPIAVGAALTVLPRSSITSDLIRQAKSLLTEMGSTDGEAISFFDFVEGPPGPIRVARDYLCFPEFYPLSLILKGLHQSVSPLSLPGVALRRLDVADSLLALINDGRPYRLRGAKFAATVDQAMIALAYENLNQSKSRLDPIVDVLRPLGNRLRESWISRVIAPVLLLGLAAASMEDPSSVAELLQFFGFEASGLEEWLGGHESLVRFAVATFIIVTPGLPLSALKFVRRKLSA